MISIKERNVPKSVPEDEISTGIAENEVDPVVLESVKKLIQLLNNTLKSLLIYPKNNPLPKEFKKKFYLGLGEFLDSYDELKLEVASSSISFEGKTIYEDSDREEGIAFILHRDGIRVLSFFKGLDQSESDDFIEVMETGLRTRELEEDLVTMLWEKDFNHVKYLVVDDLLDVQIPSAGEIPDSWNFHRLFSSEIAEAGQKATADSDSTVQYRQEQTKELLKKLKEFSPEEIDNIQELLELEEGHQSLDEFFDILTEILMVEPDISEFSSMMEAVEKITGALVTIADFFTAANIMTRLRRFEEMIIRISPDPSTLQTRKAERTRQVIDQAGEEEKIKKVTQILNEKEGTDLATVKEYLFSLNLNSISSILHMLRELKEFQARRMVCELLVAKGKNKLEIIREGLSDRNWYVIRNVIWVIGGIGSAEGVKYLKPLAYHLDFRIRREIITSLIKIPGPEAGALLVLLLNDEDKRIRSLACMGLSKRKESGALPKLNEILKDELFRDKSPDEKKHLLETCVTIGRNEAIPLLFRMIEKRSWLKRDKHNESRIFAVGALGLIDTDEAKEALLALSKKRNKVLRKACEDALRWMELRKARGRESYSDVS